MKRPGIEQWNARAAPAHPHRNLRAAQHDSFVTHPPLSRRLLETDRFRELKPCQRLAVPLLPDGVEASDPNDAFLLAMALAGEADDLVTGDRRAGLLQQGSIGRTRIVTPAIFCAEAL